MKQFALPFAVLLLVVGLLVTTIVYGQGGTNPKFDAKIRPAMPAQSQASSLAVPTPEAMPKHVMVIVLCNNVVAAGVIDDAGDWHETHLVSKAQLDSLLKLVPASEDISMNLGCPTDATKDTPVL